MMVIIAVEENRESADEKSHHRTNRALVYYTFSRVGHLGTKDPSHFAEWFQAVSSTNHAIVLIDVYLKLVEIRMKF